MNKIKRFVRSLWLDGVKDFVTILIPLVIFVCLIFVVFIGAIQGYLIARIIMSILILVYIASIFIPFFKWIYRHWKYS